MAGEKEVSVVKMSETQSDWIISILLNISKLAVAAKASGNPDLMYAANRAWRQLDEFHRRAVLTKDEGK